MSNIPDQSRFKENAKTPNGIFPAVVVGSDAGTYTVQIAPKGGDRPACQAIPLASTLAHLLGFKECMLPQIGSVVLCCDGEGEFCYIIGTIPKSDDILKDQNYPNRSIVGAGDSTFDKQNTLGYADGDSSKLRMTNSERPTDVVEGEYVLNNNFGVTLGLFSQLALLKGSDLSQIQCHLLDDLVRIVSHNFQHFTCLGQFQVFHDGRNVHMEFGATHDATEAMGVPQTVPNTQAVLEDLTQSSSGSNTQQESDVSASDDSKDYIKLKHEKLVPIERLKGFVGQLGNLVNIMLVRPHESALRALDGNLEVPVEDPAGGNTDITGGATENYDRGLFNFHLSADGAATIRSLKGIFLEKTSWIRVPHRVRAPEDPNGDDATKIQYPQENDFVFDNSSVSESRPYGYFLQLRNYLAYINEGMAYGNFKAHKKDFIVNDDLNSETPLTDMKKVTATQNSQFQEGTAGIYLMPNGGVVIQDAWGSAIVMEGGNIHLQPAYDLIEQPLRNMVLKVGNQLSINARKDIDISSSTGGMRVKTEDTQYLYSNKSGVIVHANGPLSTEYAPDPTKDKMPVKQNAGILLLSPNAGVYQHGKYCYAHASNYYAVEADNLILDAVKRADILSKKDINMYSVGSTFITSKNMLIGYSDSNAIFVGSQHTMVGRAYEEGGVKDPIGIVKNNVVYGLVPKTFLERYASSMDKVANTMFKNVSPIYKDETKFTKLKFLFPDSSHYGINKVEDRIPETIIQQQDDTFKDQGLVPWKEVSVNDTYPYPGKEINEILLTAELYNLQKDEKGNLYNKATDLHGEASKKPETQDIFTKYKVRNY